MRIWSVARMMAWLDDAQAETVQKLGPINPYFMEMYPAAMSDIIFGMKKGLKRGICPPSRKPAISSNMDLRPPMPEAQITPERSLSTFSRSMPESVIAWSAAIMAYCEKRSYLRTSLRSKKSSKLYPFTSQANLVLNFSASKCVMGAAPLTPAFRLAKYSCMLLPSGLIVPIPVTTTLLFCIAKSFIG